MPMDYVLVGWKWLENSEWPEHRSSLELAWIKKERTIILSIYIYLLCKVPIHAHYFIWAHSALCWWLEWELLSSFYKGAGTFQWIGGRTQAHWLRVQASGPSWWASSNLGQSLLPCTIWASFRPWHSDDCCRGGQRDSMGPPFFLHKT